MAHFINNYSIGTTVSVGGVGKVRMTVMGRIFSMMPMLNL